MVGSSSSSRSGSANSVAASATAHAPAAGEGSEHRTLLVSALGETKTVEEYWRRGPGAACAPMSASRVWISAIPVRIGLGFSLRQQTGAFLAGGKDDLDQALRSAGASGRAGRCAPAWQQHAAVFRTDFPDNHPNRL